MTGAPAFDAAHDRDLDAEIGRLRAEIDRLRAEVARLREQNAALVAAANARDYERPPHYL